MFKRIKTTIATTTLLMTGHAFGALDYVEGEFLVKLKSGSTKSDVMQSFKKLNVNVEKVLRNSDGKILKIKSDTNHSNLIKKISTLSEVELIEPNYIFKAISTDINLSNEDYLPEDKNFLQQWGLLNLGQKLDTKYKMTRGADIKILKAWSFDSSVPFAASDIKVAVIDTGINLKHQDLKDNLWTNTGEQGEWRPQNQDDVDRAPGCWDKSCNKLDDDGNGYVDDIHGWNWSAKQSNWKKASNPNDDQGHGTHCAGVIGASHNDKGISGINAKVQMMALKFLDKKGAGTLEGAVEAVNYAADKGAHIINASWGGNGHSQILKDSISRATEKGVLFVAAAGNAALNNDIYPSVPANYGDAGVLSVAASEFNDERASFSNYGKSTVDLAAPGHVIYSTVLGKKGYQYMSGTSMAAPHVAGVAALVMGFHPEFRYNPEELKKYLKVTADRKVELNWLFSSGGRLNAFNAIKGFIPEGNKSPEDRRRPWGVKDYKIESAHPYQNNQSVEYLIHEPGAEWIKIKFGKHHLETGSDHLEIYDGKGNLFDSLTGFGFEAESRPIKGDTVRIVLRTDKVVTGWGFEINSINFIK